jgi:plastocyanin
VRKRTRTACAAAVAVWLWLPAEGAGATVELALTERQGTPLAEAVLAAFPLAPRPQPPAAPAVLDQRERKFVPHILPVQLDTRVRFPNSDSVSHHVYSFSSAKRFEIFLPKGESAQEVVFDRPGVVTLGCNIHDWMLAYVWVVDTPYFVQTDAEGRARLADLPAGDYRLQLWHPRITDDAARLERRVTLAADGEERWRLALERPLLPARDQRRGFQEY